jgi:hypothetical protein
MMKLSITIEVDDSDQNVQYCGANCAFRGNSSFCCLFEIPLEDHCSNKIDVDNGKVRYESTKEIHGCRRPDRCTAIFSSFGSRNTA